jgi:galactitol-specific phosphotransferase system IIB component
VLDIMEMKGGAGISMSHIAARQEVRELLKTLRIPILDEHINKQRLEEEEAKSDAPAASEEKPAVAAAETVAVTAAVMAASSEPAKEEAKPEAKELEALAS